jgi:hypothetical protein
MPCEIRYLPPHSHKEQDNHHKFKLDESIPKWKGKYCFRRSLAANLCSLGVEPPTIATILWHADISTMQNWYVEISASESREALDKLTLLVDNKVTPK